MYKGKKIALIIAAAGSGKRMCSGIPKQYMKINGETILAKTTKLFYNNDLIDEICIVINKEFIQDFRAEFKSEFKSDKPVYFVEGGKERQDSVYNGLCEIASRGFDYVLIHDGARPFVSKDLISTVVKELFNKKAVVVAVPVKDTIRTKEETLDRSKLFSVQTPQAFERNIIMEAYEKARAENYQGTDDASLVERLGITVGIITGEYSNIKITTREDLPLEMRIGHGYDVHKLVKARKMILGGVEFSMEKGLLGHSDADVLTHAIMDALLGAANLGDIGRLFPDSDERYKDISSITLLKYVGELLEKEGYIIGNIDATVMAERPRVSPRKGEIISNICQALKVDESKVSVKGTTTEKLGFTGREEGIAAEAVCMIAKGY